MGSTLYWRPIIKERNCLSDELKFIMVKEYKLPAYLDESDMGFLRGLVAAGVPTAKELCNAIETYGRVYIEESY